MNWPVSIDPQAPKDSMGMGNRSMEKVAAHYMENVIMA